LLPRRRLGRFAVIMCLWLIGLLGAIVGAAAIFGVPTSKLVFALLSDPPHITYVLVGMAMTPAFGLFKPIFVAAVWLDAFLPGVAYWFGTAAYALCVLAVAAYWPVLLFLHDRALWWDSGSAYAYVAALVVIPSPWFLYFAARAAD
jgi:hypothetical protein